MRFHSYLNSAVSIINTFTCDEPLSGYLKRHFAANKKYGSKDRKQIGALVYHFYRLGKTLPNTAVEEKIVMAVFLCTHNSSDFLAFHKPEWNNQIGIPIADKLALLQFDANTIFPWKEELSEGIDHQAFSNSIFIQPDLFVRIRPGKNETVINKIKEAGLDFNLIADDCIALPNASKIDTVLAIDKEVVIQDYNSQQVLNYLKQPASIKQSIISAWDCCAASGGKSILLSDILDQPFHLQVSDIRENILVNLEKRFAAAGIKNFKSSVANLATPNDKPPKNENYQLIICDAPCSGSGTWGRTPEQLHYFKPKALLHYSDLQKKIVSNIIPQLQKDGLLIYITCSVFKKENEEIVSFIQDKFKLQLVEMNTLIGYNKKADTMFTAVFKK